MDLTLTLESFKTAVNKEIIDFPDISEEEIEDKNGRDALSKSIAMLQLLWFVLQIAARSRQKLAITELELTTAALAILNIGMYIAWWKKPTDISCPTIIYSKDHKSSSESYTFGENVKVNIVAYYWTVSVNIVAHALEAIITFMKSIFNAIGNFFAAAIRSIPSYFTNVIHKLKEKKTTTSNWHYYRFIMASIPKFMVNGAEWILFVFLHVFQVLIYYPLVAILSSGTPNATPSHNLEKPGPSGSDVTKEATTSQHYKNVAVLSEVSTIRLLFKKDTRNIRLSMEMIFASEDVDSVPFFYVSAFSGMLFGMIHCLAWDFDTPSHIERLLWRVSSLGVVGLCFFMLIVGLIYNLGRFKFLHFHDPTKIVFCVRVVSSFIYVSSRLLLLTLSFLSLRALPDSALDTVQWSLFIPHI